MKCVVAQRWLTWGHFGVLMAAGLLIVPGAGLLPGSDGAETLSPGAGPGSSTSNSDPGVGSASAWAGDPLPQDDAGAGRDADNDCFAGEPPSVPVAADQDFRATLRPSVDAKDHFAFSLGGQSGEGAVITFQLEQNPDFPLGGLPVRHTAVVLTPACDVLAQAAPEGFFGAIDLNVQLEEDYEYIVIGVFWTDDLLPLTPSGSSASSDEGLLPASPDETINQNALQECHTICTSYRGTMIR